MANQQTRQLRKLSAKKPNDVHSNCFSTQVIYGEFNGTKGGKHGVYAEDKGIPGTAFKQERAYQKNKLIYKKQRAAQQASQNNEVARNISSRAA